MKNINNLILLVISMLLVLTLEFLLKKKRQSPKNQLQQLFSICLCLLFIWIACSIAQILFQNSSINPIFFEGFASIGASCVPVTFMLLGITFVKTKIKLKPSHVVLLYIIPIISTLLTFTNNYHHLIYENYSINFREIVFGYYFYIHTFYSYTCIFIGLAYLLTYTIKNSTFFSKQSVLLITGVLISVIINVVATFGILDLTVYATPMAFALSFVFFALAIFKFGFLKIAPIALQKIVDRISDGYLVVNEDAFVVDFNKTFLELFSLTPNSIRNQNLADILNSISNNKKQNKYFMDIINSTKNNDKTYKLERYFSHLEKYFNIEVNSIKSQDTFLGTLILFKDVTQHNIDIQTIKNNQEILIEKERLASLGQMIGGIAHNLKTPIMSIAGASEGLSDLIKEYDASIGDPDVTNDDHHEIAKDMATWIEKIQTHLSYMSDIISAVKGQAVAFSDDSFKDFTVNELIKHVTILMRHELKNSLIDLETNIDMEPNTIVKGNINSLIQVINNIISNAIQAYGDKKNEKILLNLFESNDNLIIKIEDFAGGLPKKVQEKLFNEMITTKGKNGTGLGLFMSYSNIKAHFNGNMRYELTKKRNNFLYRNTYEIR